MNEDDALVLMKAIGHVLFSRNITLKEFSIEATRKENTDVKSWRILIHHPDKKTQVVFLTPQIGKRVKVDDQSKRRNQVLRRSQ